MLQNVRIKKYELDLDFDEASNERYNGVKDQSVWDYVAKQNDGAMYEVVSSPNTFGANPAHNIPDESNRLIENGRAGPRNAAGNLFDSKDHMIEEEKVSNSKIDSTGGFLVPKTPEDIADDEAELIRP